MRRCQLFIDHGDFSPCPHPDKASTSFHSKRPQQTSIARVPTITGNQGENEKLFPVRVKFVQSGKSQECFKILAET